MRKKVDLLKNLNVLMTSLDGPERENDKNRQPGAYEKAIDAIKIAKDAGINVWGGVTLTKNNLGYIDYLLDTARSLDFKLLFQPIYNYAGYSAPKKQIEAMSEFGPK